MALTDYLAQCLLRLSGRVRANTQAADLGICWTENFAAGDVYRAELPYRSCK